ncbi:hypothetical protein ACH4E8_14545 [Streptomyces sp. NPDC017979]|uniref:hypothetical protein n=1 Tax=Streptomyces sp. NPDC017979 TaxID=3365024 RepID=UPI00379A16F4
MAIPTQAHAEPPDTPRAHGSASPKTFWEPGGPGAARLPEGWRITGPGEDRALVWRSPQRVPTGDARVEFYAGDRLVGRPTPQRDGHTFTLKLADARWGAGEPSDVARLRVMAAGRRLDVPPGDRGPGRTQPSERPGAAPAQLPVNPVDPGARGPYRTVSSAYELPSIRLPGFAEPVEMQGFVVAPTGAPGKRPMALFLHGRHQTCYNASGQGNLYWPCPPGWKPVPSHRGYRDSQELLASQGYVTVSVSANGINAQDVFAVDDGAQARSSLVRHHLAQWADWAAHHDRGPESVRAMTAADLSKVLLIGHSRGGEGVNRAALDSLHRPPADQGGYQGPVRWRIRGTALIAPTAFGQNPAPDVPSMTLLPACDGDVNDLQGQLYVDGTRGVGSGTALHSSVYVVGANHNYFNSEWTPGQAEAPASDDFHEIPNQPDAVCSQGAPTRLTPAQQQSAGATYLAAAARLFVAGDDRVRPLLDGTGHRAPSVGTARVLAHAVGGNRTPLVLPDAEAAPTVEGGRLCRQVDIDLATQCLPLWGEPQSPHFAPWRVLPELGRQTITARWTQPGTPVRVRPAAPVSLAGAHSVALRIAVPPNTTSTRLDVALTDASGRRSDLGQVTVDGLPGTDRTASVWAQEVRLPLSAATGAGVDLARVAALELTPRGGPGQLWLMDAWGWRAGTPETRPATLPRIDVGQLTVQEGDTGERTYRVPVHVSGEGSGQVRLTDPAGEQRLVTVRPGTNSVDVPVTVRGDTLYGRDESHTVAVKAVRNAAVGSDLGSIQVVDDDAPPRVDVTAVADRVTEGQPLAWRVTLSAPVEFHLWDVSLVVEPVTGGPELSTTDVPAAWLDQRFGASPLPERPLSRVHDRPAIEFEIPRGQTSTEVQVPTVADGIGESEEALRLRARTSWELAEGPVVTGTVRDPS